MDDLGRPDYVTNDDMREKLSEIRAVSTMGGLTRPRWRSGSSLLFTYTVRLLTSSSKTCGTRVSESPPKSTPPAGPSHITIRMRRWTMRQSQGETRQKPIGERANRQSRLSLCKWFADGLPLPRIRTISPATVFQCSGEQYQGTRLRGPVRAVGDRKRRKAKTRSVV
jgi:hypothetical protein